jgi:hypothetical protein
MALYPLARCTCILYYRILDSRGGGDFGVGWGVGVLREWKEGLEIIWKVELLLE